MLSKIGGWVHAQLENRMPWTDVYGAARSLLAISGLITLLANDAHALFVPLSGMAEAPPFCGGHAAVGLYCVVPDLGLARWIAIAVLVVVASGWRPRITGVAHWWVAASFQWSASILDGGDQVCMVLTLLLVPITLLDRRRWHWSAPDSDRSSASKLIAWSAGLAIRVQVAAIYYHAGVAKYAVDQWNDGTSLWYWFRNPTFGAPEFLKPVVDPVIRSATLLPVLTWSVLLLEFLLAAGLWMRPSARRVLLPVGCCFHVGIGLIHGIGSFAIAMIAALILYLRPTEQVFGLARMRVALASLRMPRPAARTWVAPAALLLLVLGGCGRTATPVDATARPTSPAPARRVLPEPGAFARDFIAELASGAAEDAAARLTGRAAAERDAEALAEAWSSLERRYGPFDRVLATSSHEDEGDDVHHVDVRLGFESANVNARLDMADHGAISRLVFDEWEPPAYGDRSRISERDVIVGTGHWQLPGSLTLPRGDARVPAVVLVHGSGPADRDASLGKSKIFRDLAWGLATRGVAVLRYEKRTRQYARLLAEPSVLPTLTVKEETIDDAVAAVALLRARPEIDPQRIFVVGHSLGGYLAPRIAEADPRIAGLVLASTAVTPLPELIRKQVAYLAELDGTVSVVERVQIGVVSSQLADIEELTPESIENENERPRFYLGVGAAYWVDLQGYDPAEALLRVPTPALIVNGSRDYQAPPTELAQWRSKLGKRARTQLVELAALDHLLVSGEGASDPKDYALARHVDVAAIDLIAGWILKR